MDAEFLRYQAAIERLGDSLAEPAPVNPWRWLGWLILLGWLGVAAAAVVSLAGG